MRDKAKKPETEAQADAAAISQWDNEGGAPSSGKRPTGKYPKRPLDTSQRAKPTVIVASGEVEDRVPTPEEEAKDRAG